jgi:hypothetical protein
VNGRALSVFIDALVKGRRPSRFRADPEDVAVLRTAIALRSSRPGDGIPDEQFVSDLYADLVDHMQSPVAASAPPPKMRRGRVALAAAAAAAVAIVGGTVTATEALNRPSVTPAAVQAPHGTTLRTGTFQAVDGRVMGQIVVYRGHPSWVFMNVGGTSYNGPVVCDLQAADGSTVAAGSFDLHAGMGQFSRTIRVDIGQLRGAKLVTSTGTAVAYATFA